MSKPILDILQGKPSKHMPIWLMRQAGRYLPEYRELRVKAGNFLDLCLTPHYASEITLQPIRRFHFDAAILFADILLIPYALGQKLEFREGEGPHMDCLEDLNSLKLHVDKLTPVFETVSAVKKQLPEQTALIGFCGGPWTVAAYMIDGNSRNNFAEAKKWLVEKPDLFSKLINILIDASEDYLCRQIESGAEILQIFESWAGLLTGDEFNRWVIQPTQELVKRIKYRFPDIPIIGFPREAGMNYHPFAEKAGVDAVSVDQHVSLDQAKTLQKVKPLQGNLDPALLVKGGSEMRKAAEAIMHTLGPRHIFNLGHGVVPQTPPEHVKELVEIVHGFRT